jgi:dynein heavy chain 2, cytosolic
VTRLQVSQHKVSFEREIKPLRDLFLTPETLSTVAQIDAAISRPSGSLLLISRHSGHRRALVELISHAHLLNLRSPACIASRDQVAASRSFQSFLRDCMHTVAVEGTAMVMLLEEHHLVCGDILQMVDSLLAMGEVPGLFSAEERDKLILAMTERGARGVVDDRSPQALASALVQAVKQVRTFSVCLGFLVHR